MTGTQTLERPPATNTLTDDLLLALAHERGGRWEHFYFMQAAVKAAESSNNPHATALAAMVKPGVEKRRQEYEGIPMGVLDAYKTHLAGLQHAIGGMDRLWGPKDEPSYRTAIQRAMLYIAQHGAELPQELRSRLSIKAESAKTQLSRGYY